MLKKITILGIETSCDDTCISIVESKNSHFEILSNVISSQIKKHRKHGGVYPSLAKREHQKNLIPVLKKALKKANLLNKNGGNPSFENKEFLKGKFAKKTKSFLKKYEKPEIDLIAVTQGPGLEPSLWTGINFAKTLSVFWKKPLIPVNHIESHLLINLLNEKIEFPAISLIVSGGHTQLILMKKIGDYEIIGETKDDAAGECLDKTARILGLPYPGGPEIEKRARKRNLNIRLPRPMIYKKNYDFSFSGLKTAVLYKVKKDNNNKKKYVEEMCCEIQQSIIDVLISKTSKAAEEYKAQTIILGGGVSANKELKNQFKKKFKNNLLFPPEGLSTDNAVMTSVASHYNYLKKETPPIEDIKAKGNLKIK